MAHHEGDEVQRNNFPSSKSQRTVNMIQFCFDFLTEHLCVSVAKKFGPVGCNFLGNVKCYKSHSIKDVDTK